MRHLVVALLLAAAVLVTSGPAAATVTTSTRTVSYSPAVNTSVFAVPFPFTAANDLVVVKIFEATGIGTTLTRTVGYNVQMPTAGASNGVVTTTSPVSSAYTLTITRVTPLTQTTSFTTQGVYSAARHEVALDKLTMLVQETRAAAGTSGDDAVAAHVAESDPHTQYFRLQGRTGGQTAAGGDTGGDSLRLYPNMDVDDGFIYFGYNDEMAFDGVNNRFGINDQTPDAALDVVGGVLFDSTLSVGTSTTVPTLYGSAASGGDLTLKGNSAAANGNINFGTASTYDQANNRFGIGTLTPSVALQITGGSIYVSGASSYLGLAVTGMPYVELIKSIDTATTMDLKTESDAVTAAFYLLSTASDGLYVAATGIGTYGPSHATLTGHLDLFGSTINLKDDPDTAAHSTITDDLVSLDGQLKSQSYLVETVATPTNMTTAECGVTYEGTFAAAVIQLPNIGTDAGDAAADADATGCMVTLINTFTSGTQPVSLSPHSSDSIFGSCVGVTGAGSATIIEASGTVDKDWTNTTATANKGDYTTLISNNPKAAAGIWYIVGCVGEWVSAP